MTHEIEEAELLVSIAGGDKKALGVLYDRYAPIMMSLGLRLLREQTLVEDVLHNVFLEIYRKAHTYDPERGAVKTWLLMRMRSRSVDALRKQQRNRQKHETVEYPKSIEHFSCSEEKPDETLHRNQFRQTLLELPQKDREILLLSYFQGLTVQEIADSIEVPEGTVKSRLFHARKRLRDAWEAAGDHRRRA